MEIDSLPSEFMTIRHFTGIEEGETFLQTYAGFVKDVKYYNNSDNIGEVSSEEDFKYYLNPDVYDEDEVFEKPESVRTKQ